MLPSLPSATTESLRLWERLGQGRRQSFITASDGGRRRGPPSCSLCQQASSHRECVPSILRSRSTPAMEPSGFTVHCPRLCHLLCQYDLIVVDEVSMLTSEHMDRLKAMWGAASCLPCLVLLGDFWQLPGPQRPPSSVQDSEAWREVKILDFKKVHRCKDKKLAKKLDWPSNTSASDEVVEEDLARPQSLDHQ